MFVIQDHAITLTSNFCRNLRFVKEISTRIMGLFWVAISKRMGKEKRHEVDSGLRHTMPT